jgi:homoaconitase/3-isopropylmalate dehydratase large subunit
MASAPPAARYAARADHRHGRPRRAHGRAVHGSGRPPAVEALRRNCAQFGIRLFPVGDPDQGIVHVVGPAFGLTRPGMTVVSGDSHTSTHGAFGALAFGIGTSEVEHVLATQTLTQRPPGQMLVVVEGDLPSDVTGASRSRSRDVSRLIHGVA